MNHQYEKRLGTDRMLPLIFKMALPAVIAQIIMASTESMAGFALGFVPIVSYNYGHGNRERVKGSLLPLRQICSNQFFQGEYYFGMA